MDTELTQFVINEMTKAQAETNAGQLNEKEFIVLSDLQMPIPTTADVGKVLAYGQNGFEFKDVQHTQQIVYDNTTLADHITEILGYVNTENGGMLISLGFKIGETAVSGERKTVTLNTTDNTITTATDTNTIIGAGEFVYATPAVMGISNSQKEITFLLATERDNYTSANLDISAISGNSAKVSGQKFGYLPNSIVTSYFQEIDILNTNLEHLVLNVME